jgi:hypothetical protein
MKSQFNRYRPPTTRNAVENRSRTLGTLQQANAAAKSKSANQFSIPHQQPNPVKQNKNNSKNAGQKLI